MTPIVIQGSGGVSFAAPTTGVGSSASAGVATTALRSDSTFKIPLVLGGLIPIGGGRFKRVQGVDLATGNNDLYTCPANTRAFVVGAWGAYVDGIAAVTSQPYIQFLGAGTRYPICSVNTALAASASASFTAGGMVLEPTDKIGVTTSVTNGINITFVVFEFPNTVPFKSVFAKDNASGDTTLYTCPAATNAFVTGATTPFTTGGSQQVNYVNGSGGSLNVYYNIVPTGSTAGATNQLVVATAVAGTTITRSSLGTSVGIALNAGDFISINWSGVNTGGITWITVAEIAGV